MNFYIYKKNGKMTRNLNSINKLHTKLLQFSNEMKSDQVGREEENNPLIIKKPSNKHRE